MTQPQELVANRNHNIPLLVPCLLSIRKKLAAFLIDEVIDELS